MSTQIVHTLGNHWSPGVVSLIPVVLLLILLAVFRQSPRMAALVGSLVTFALAQVIICERSKQ